MSARPSTFSVAPPTRKRRGPITKPEQALVTQLVLDHPGELSPKQVRGLAMALRRPKEVIQSLVEDARADFAAQAPDYVKLHRRAVEAGLHEGTAAGLQVAQKGAQWYLERVGEGQTRVIEKTNTETPGQKILIGIQLGGIGTAKAKVVASE